MKFHQFFIISLCNFIWLTCYSANAQTVGGAAAAPQVSAVFSPNTRCNRTNLAAENCVLGELYHPLSLRCVHPLNDSFTTRWYYSKDGADNTNSYTPVKATDDGRVKVSGNQIDISQLSSQDITLYSCRVILQKSASDNDDVTPFAQGTFEVQALPMAIPILKDMTVVEGSQINVSCYVTGKANGIAWKFGEKDLFNGTENRVTLKEFRGIPNATLLISQANSTTDRGTYHCTAMSIYGNGTSIGSTFVRVKSKYAALGPFLGICAEVIILCTIILIYEKKRDKTELEESDTDQGPETKSSPDHGQDSVRYRK